MLFAKNMPRLCCGLQKEPKSPRFLRGWLSFCSRHLKQTETPRESLAGFYVVLNLQGELNPPPPPPPKDVWKVYTFFSTSKRSQTPTWFFWGLYCILNDISCSWFHFCKACLIIVILKEFPTIDFIFVIHLFYFCVSWGV
jgi:hypothetical protein